MKYYVGHRRFVKSPHRKFQGDYLALPLPPKRGGWDWMSRVPEINLWSRSEILEDSRFQRETSKHLAVMLYVTSLRTAEELMGTDSSCWTMWIPWLRQWKYRWWVDHEFTTSERFESEFQNPMLQVFVSNFVD